MVHEDLLRADGTRGRWLPCQRCLVIRQGFQGPSALAAWRQSHDEVWEQIDDDLSSGVL